MKDPIFNLFVYCYEKKNLFGYNLIRGEQQSFLKSREENPPPPPKFLFVENMYVTSNLKKSSKLDPVETPGKTINRSLMETPKRRDQRNSKKLFEITFYPPLMKTTVFTKYGQTVKSTFFPVKHF